MAGYLTARTVRDDKGSTFFEEGVAGEARNTFLSQEKMSLCHSE